MIAFKLERFPHVCRTCLQPKAKSQMTSLGETRDKDGGTRLIDLLDELTFPIPEVGLSCRLLVGFDLV